MQDIILSLSNVIGAHALDIYLRLNSAAELVGFAIAPTWNRAWHRIDASRLITTDESLYGAIAIEFKSDGYVAPPPEMRQAIIAITAKAIGEGFSGTYEINDGALSRSGMLSARAAPPIRAEKVEFELVLDHIHTWGEGKLWKQRAQILFERICGENRPGIMFSVVGPIGGMTAPVDATAIRVRGGEISAELTLQLRFDEPENYPHPLSEDVKLSLRGIIIGTRIAGEYTRTGQDNLRTVHAFGGTLKPRFPGPRRTFAHPCLLNTTADITYIREMLSKNAQPWSIGLDAVSRHAAAFLAHNPQPFNSSIGTHHSKPGDIRALMADGRAAYGLALLFTFTGEPEYAVKAADIIRAWVTTLQSVKFGNTLMSQYTWPTFCWAVELLRDFPMTGENFGAFQRLLRDVVYPAAHWSFHRSSNTHSWNLCFRMSCAVILDDSDMFNEVLEDYPDHVTTYIKVDGRVADKRPDLGHIQMGLAPMVAVCETAWKQGIDLYCVADNRLLSAIEWVIPFLTGEKQHPDRGSPLFFDFYEMAYNHFHHRRGVSTPHLERFTLQRRPEDFSRIGWGTLTHAGVR